MLSLTDAIYPIAKKGCKVNCYRKVKWICNPNDGYVKPT
jgi:hypothetical protein